MSWQQVATHVCNLGPFLRIARAHGPNEHCEFKWAPPVRRLASPRGPGDPLTGCPDESDSAGYALSGRPPEDLTAKDACRCRDDVVDDDLLLRTTGCVVARAPRRGVGSYATRRAPRADDEQLSPRSVRMEPRAIARS